MRVFSQSLYEAGIVIQVPMIEGVFTVESHDDGGACGIATSTVGFDVKVQWGYNIYGYIGEDYQNADWDWQIASQKNVIWEECWDYGFIPESEGPDPDHGPDGPAPPDSASTWCEEHPNSIACEGYVPGGGGH